MLKVKVYNQEGAEVKDLELNQTNKHYLIWSYYKEHH